MAKSRYIYIRGLELSGNHPASVGEWLVTMHRLRHGEGEPFEDDPDFEVEWEDENVLPPTPKIPPERLHKTRAYRRIRSSQEGVDYIKRKRQLFQACLYTFPTWAYPPGGYIPLPDPDEKPLDFDHCVLVTGFNEFNDRFRFQNSWGAWGEENRGIGYIDFAYLDRYGFEAWALYREPNLIDPLPTPFSNYELFTWKILDEHARTIHGFQILGLGGVQEERRAWAFVLETEDSLELEELFVHPDHRELGYGRILADQIRSLVNRKQKPLRMWVPFSDTERESPKTYPRMVTLARALGIKFVRCPEKWAAYYGATDIAGSDFPVPPVKMPGRPQSMHDMIILAALSGFMMDVDPPMPPAAVVQQAYPDIDSAAWKLMNRRRGDLITKEFERSLTGEEKKLLDKLQFISYEQLKKRFPAPSAFEEEIRQLRNELKGERK